MACGQEQQHLKADALKSKVSSVAYKTHLVPFLPTICLLTDAENGKRLTLWADTNVHSNALLSCLILYTNPPHIIAVQQAGNATSWLAVQLDLINMD